ncbi:MAG: tetratricopeptide repeat protein [Candidatus Tectimicrobiota bacterium]
MANIRVVLLHLSLAISWGVAGCAHPPALPPVPVAPLALPAQPTIHAPEALALSQRAEAQERAGASAEAMLLYTQALAHDPTYGAAYQGRARVYAMQGQYTAAIAELQQARRVAPNEFDASRPLAWYLLLTQQLLEARQISLAAYASDPDTPTWAILLGHTFLLSGDQAMAATYYSQAMATLESEQMLSTELLEPLQTFIAMGWQVEACDHSQAMLRQLWGQTASWRAQYIQGQTLRRAQQIPAALAATTEAARLAESYRGTTPLYLALSLQQRATILQAQGANHEAEAVYQQAFSLFRQVWGSEHLAVATPLEQLATLAYERHDYAQADVLYTQAMQIVDPAVGPRHQRIAALLNARAAVAEAQGQYAEAERFYHQALPLWDALLGPTHPAVAATLTALGSLARQQHRFTEALALYARALAIWQATVPLPQREIAQVLGNLANVLQRQERSAEAETHYRQALILLEALRPPPTRDIAVTLNNLATLYRQQRRYPEALTHYERALQMQERTLPPGHPDLALTLTNLATLYQDQQQPEQALPRYKRALGLFKATFGPFHPYVATTYYNLAVLGGYQGQYQTALPAIREATAIYHTRARRARLQRWHEVQSTQTTLQPIIAYHLQLLLAAAACAAHETALETCNRPAYSMAKLPPIPGESCH